MKNKEGLLMWVKTIFLTLLVPGVAVFLVPFFLQRPSGFQLNSSPWIAALGIMTIFLGVFSFSWVSQAFVRFGKGTPAPFDPPRQFVARGLYRFVRNPMYLGAVLVILGEALLFWSWHLLAYAAAMLTMLHFFVIFYEESSLLRRFGEPYQDYLRTVPRWFPRFRAMK
jgi:protein-S-isoprenylcysteine O-methyltransferase Ste14